MRNELLFSPLICVMFIATLTTELTYPIVQAEDIIPEFEEPSIDYEIGSVNSIIQDRYGYLWFGTEYSLVRYDGTESISYQYSSSESGSISGLCINAIYETAEGDIWIGTEGGLDKYNRIDGTFQNYIYDLDNPESSSYNYITTLTEDEDGTLWVGTRNGLNSFDQKTEVFTRYYNNPDDATSISNNDITAILEDSEGILWIGTQDGLNRFDNESGTFTRYYYLDSEQTSIGISAIYETEDGILWVGTEDGLTIFDKIDETFITYYLSPDNYSGYNTGSIEVILEDRDNVLWIGTSNGLLSCDRKENYIKYYSDNSSQLSNSINTICQSSEGILWFGTSGGLYKLDQKKTAFNNYTDFEEAASSLSTDSVKSFCGLSDGSILIRARSASYKLSQETKEFTLYKDSLGDTGNLDIDSAGFIYEDSKGYIWLATSEAINKLDPETGAVSEYYASNGESIDPVNTIFEDSNGNLLVATPNNFYKLDSDTGQFIDYFTNTELIDSLMEDIIWKIFEDSYGYLWIGTDRGVYVINSRDETFSHYSSDPYDANSLAGDRVKVITEDSEGNIWIGTSEGLSKFNRDATTFTNYRVEDGLPSNIICGLVEDDNGYLWISTVNGLSRFDTITGFFANYSTSNGLDTVIFNYGACYKAQDGELFFGGINGLVSFYPDELLVMETVVPSVLIKSFNTFNDQDSGTYDQPIEDMGKIDLQYSSNSFEIGFVAIDYTSPENNQYAYILVGFDEDWHYTDGTKNSATYTNIPSGEYTFIIKAANSDGIWNEEGTSLQIIIATPWWQSWWFILSLAAATILLVFTAIRLRTHALHVRAQRLEAHVKERTVELAKSNRRLKKEIAERRQAHMSLQEYYYREQVLIQDLEKEVAEHAKTEQKLKDQNDQKARFMRMLVHELKTPLTPLLSISESLLAERNEETITKQLKSLNNGATRLSKRIDELMDLSKGETGLLKIENERVDLLSMLEDAATYMEPYIIRRGQTLIKEVPQSLPVVSGDSERLWEVVNNLLDNASKFTPKKGNIVLRARVVETDVAIEIQNSGTSLTKEQRQGIFQPYHKLHSHKDGLGLGLALAKMLVELHGGRIWVREDKGKGNVFGFSLPVYSKPD